MSTASIPHKVTPRGLVAAVLLCALLSLGAAPPTDQSIIWRRGFSVPQGFVNDGELFAIHEYTEYAVPHRHLEIYKAAVPAKAGDATKQKLYQRAQFARPYQPLGPTRWRIYGGYYWEDTYGVTFGGGSFTRVPLKDLKYYDPKDDVHFLDWIETPTETWDPSPLETISDDVARVETKRIWGGDGKGILPCVIRGVYYDLLPLSQTEALLFVLHKKKLRVWKGTGVRDKKKPREWEFTWAEQKADAFETTLDEPFQVYGSAANWFLLTRDGTLRLCRKPEKGARKFEVFYQSKDAPLRALITDVAKDKTYAFTSPARTGKGKYFEVVVGGSAKTRDFTLASDKADAKLNEPLRTLMGYARVLVADKAITAKK